MIARTTTTMQRRSATTGGDGEWIGQRPNVVTPTLIASQMARGRAAFDVGDTRISLDTIYELAGYDEAAIEANAEIEALLAEVDSKPNLGSLDSAGRINYDADLEDLIEDRLDQEFWAHGC